MELAHLVIWALLPLFATCRVLLPHLITNTSSLRPFNRPVIESEPSKVWQQQILQLRCLHLRQSGKSTFAVARSFTTRAELTKMKPRGL